MKWKEAEGPLFDLLKRHLDFERVDLGVSRVFGWIHWDAVEKEFTAFKEGYDIALSFYSGELVTRCSCGESECGHILGLASYVLKDIHLSKRADVLFG